jgi:rod shape-determining protein MreD
MLSGLVLVVAMAAACIAQAALPAVAAFGGVRWPVLTAVVIHYALHHRAGFAAAAAVGAGTILDTLSGSPFGLSVLILGGVTALTRAARRWVHTESWAAVALVGATGCLVATLATGVWLSRAGLIVTGGGGILWRATGAALLGALCVPVVALLIGRLDGSAREDRRTADGFGV